MFAWMQQLWERMRHGTRPGNARRSKDWPDVEKAHKVFEPACQHCGRLDFVEVHHIAEFRDRPDLELVSSNHISLCRPPGSLFGSKEYPEGSCHFRHGHKDPVTGKCSWKTCNPNIRAECDAHQAERRHKEQAKR